jgi:hypothetical protein
MTVTFISFVLTPITHPNNREGHCERSEATPTSYLEIILLAQSLRAERSNPFLPFMFTSNKPLFRQQIQYLHRLFPACSAKIRFRIESRTNFWISWIFINSTSVIIHQIYASYSCLFAIRHAGYRRRNR